MTDAFARGATWLRSKLRTHAARAITITDRELNPAVSITLPATPGRTQFEESTTEGAILATESRDWIVTASELQDLFGDPARLRSGWIVTDSLDGSRYEIRSPAGGRPWRWSDTANTTIRIHTKALDR